MKIEFDETFDTEGLKQKLRDFYNTAKQVTSGTITEAEKMNAAYRDVTVTVSKMEAASGVSASKTADAVEDLAQNIQIQKRVIEDLRSGYLSTLNALDNSGLNEGQKEVLLERMRGVREELDAEKSALVELEQNQKRYVEYTRSATTEQDSSTQSLATFETQVSKVRDQMGNLILEGQRNTQEYRDLESELGRLGATYQELQHTQAVASKGGSQWSGLISGVQGLAGAFSVYQGIIGLVAKDDEKLQAIQAEIQKTMGVLMGMQQLANTLHQTSDFRIKTVAKATEIWNAVNTKTSAGLVALGFSARAANIATTALYATLTLGLSVAIGAAVTWYSNWRDKQEEVRKKQEELNKATQDFAKSVGDNASKAVTAYKALQTQWNALGDDLNKKKKFITDNADAFKELGIYVGGVADAENVFIRNSDAMLNAIMLRAKAAAGMSLASEKYKEALEKEIITQQFKADKRTPGFGQAYKEAEERAKKELGVTFTFTSDQKSEYYNDLNNLIDKYLYQEPIELANKLRATADAAINTVVNTNKDLAQSLKTAGITTTDEADAEKARKEAAAKAAEAKRKEIADAELAATKALYDAETELKRKQIEDKIELMEFDLSETLNRLEEQAKAEEEAKHPEAAKTIRKQKVVVEQSVQVDIDAEKAARSTAEAQAMNEYLAQYGDYLQKRKALADLYAEKITNAETQGEKKSLGEELKAKYAELDREAFKTTSAISKLFSDMSKKSVEEMRAVADEAERMLDFITSGEYDENNAWGISKETFDLQSKSSKELEAIKDEIAEVRNEADQAENAFNKMGDGLKKIFSGDLKGGLEALTSGLGGIKQASDFLADSFSNLGDAFGSETLNDIAEGFKTVSDVADSTMKGISAGFAAGGPIGGAIGGAIGLISGIIGGIGKRLAYNKKVREEYQASLRHEYLAEYEINSLYRERYEWAQKIGETTLDYLNRNAKELDAQAAANAKEQEELWAKLMGSEYVSNETYKHGTWFRKAKVIKDYSSLSGKSFEDIELLAAQGKLTDEANAYYEALKKAKEEGEDLASRLEQLAEETREAFTGIGFDSLVDGIVDGFKDGKRSAADFADNFEDLMRNAVLQSLKMNALEAPLRKWYEDFADKASDEEGLTAAEIAALKAQYEQIVNSAADQLEELEKITGIDIESQQQATSKGFQAMSQDTGNELNGRFTVMTDLMAKQLEIQKVMRDANLDTANATFNIRDLMQSANNHLSAIRDNTSYLQGIDGRLKKIEENTAYLK